MYRIFKTCYIFSVSFPLNCSLFHKYNVFGSCLIHILYTGVKKFKKNSGAKRIISNQNFVVYKIFNYCFVYITYIYIERAESENL